MSIPTAVPPVNPPPPPGSDKSPSPWSLIHDDSKTIITLATVFLGFTVTFSDKLLANNATNTERYLLIVIWIILCLVIGLGINASAELSNFLRRKTSTANSSITSLLVSFILLVVAFVLFVIFGGFQVSKKTTAIDAASTLNIAVDFLVASHANSKDRWIPESLIWDQTAHNYQIVVLNNLNQSKFLVVIDGKTGNVIKFEQKP